MKFKQFKLTPVALISAVLAAVLTACGGGPDATTTTATTPVVVASNLVQSVPAPSYSPALQGEELAAFNLLNAERLRCGFGVLAQSSQLDAAALGHADWQLVNGIAGHYQTTGTTGFTGVTPGDRTAGAGYLGAVSDEIYSILGSGAKSGFGTTSIRSLLNAPYHLAGLVASYRDIGIAVRNDVDTSTTGTYGARIVTQVDLGYSSAAGPQSLGSTDVQTYPCAGSTGINRQLVNETPSPVIGRNLATSPLGSTVYVVVRDGQTIAITSASMTKVSNNTPVVLRTPIVAANDPNSFYRSHQAYISADAPLDAGTQYSVTIHGTNDGTAFVKSFTFTTGF